MWLVLIDFISLFLALFLLYSIVSVVKDFAHGSASMDPVIDTLKSDDGSAFGQMIRGMHDKPLSRCEKCTKTPEEIGDHIKFMLCSVCKAKLKFSVHYCSRCML